MAIQFRLPEDVRERYGVTEEWVSYDASVVMLNDAIELEDLLGWTPDELIENRRTAVMDAATGQQKVDADGDPMWRPNYRAWKFMIWAAAKHAGATVAYSDFDLDIVRLESKASESDADPKEPAQTDDLSTPESSPVDDSVPSTT